jgi:hypothetical protein
MADDSFASAHTLKTILSPSRPLPSSPLVRGTARQNGKDHRRESDASTAPPVDRYRFVYWSFFLLGVGMLFPWNMFITAHKYNQIRLRGSPYADNFNNFFSVGFMVSNVIFLILLLRNLPMVSWIFKRGRLWQSSLQKTIGALAVNAAVFLACTVIALVSAIDAYTFFYFNLAMTIICGASTAFLQNGISTVWLFYLLLCDRCVCDVL